MCKDTYAHKFDPWSLSEFSDPDDLAWVFFRPGVLDMSQDWLNTKKAADIGLRHMEKAELKDDDAKGKFHYRKGASVKGDDLFFSLIFNKGHVVDLNVNLLWQVFLLDRFGRGKMARFWHGECQRLQVWLNGAKRGGKQGVLLIFFFGNQSIAMIWITRFKWMYPNFGSFYLPSEDDKFPSGWYRVQNRFMIFRPKTWLTARFRVEI